MADFSFLCDCYEDFLHKRKIALVAVIKDCLYDFVEQILIYFSCGYMVGNVLGLLEEAVCKLTVSVYLKECDGQGDRNALVSVLKGVKFARAEEQMSDFIGTGGVIIIILDILKHAIELAKVYFAIRSATAMNYGQAVNLLGNFKRKILF